jgi:3-phosphoshikimate 1-carboxyvinyltransferase
MNVTILPSVLKGNIRANASKSSMQRACAAALIAACPVLLRNPGNSNDDLAALDIIRRLGASVSETSEGLLIKSNGVKPVADEIHCGESGLSIRMFTPIAALSEISIAITGSGSLVSRPMNFFDEIFPRLHVSVESRDGKLPLQIKGPLHPENLEIDGSLSSQFLTGLLMAYAAAGAENVSVRVRNLKSRPYVDLTLEVMRRFGLKVPENRNYEEFYFNELPLNNSAQIDYTVEGDWSGAAFLLVAGALVGPVTIQGLDLQSTQADKAILQAIKDAGAKLSADEKQIIIGPNALKPFAFNATECPDLFPPLVALAAYCDGASVIEGTSRLIHKESNRALTLQQEFAKMGVDIELEEDKMIVHGKPMLNAAVVHSRHDHRIAMACAVAALKAEGPVKIEEANAIDKSYPAFFEHLLQLGANVLYN